MRRRGRSQAAHTPVAETCVFVHTYACMCTLPGWSEWVGGEGSEIGEGRQKVGLDG